MCIACSAVQRHLVTSSTIAVLQDAQGAAQSTASSPPQMVNPSAAQAQAQEWFVDALLGVTICRQAWKQRAGLPRRAVVLVRATAKHIATGLAGLSPATADSWQRWLRRSVIKVGTHALHHNLIPACPLIDWPSVLQVDKQNAAEHHKASGLEYLLANHTAGSYKNSFACESQVHGKPI